MRDYSIIVSGYANGLNVMADFPTKCPICGENMSPEVLHCESFEALYERESYNEPDLRLVQCICRCTSEKCREHYMLTMQISVNENRRVDFLKFVPNHYLHVSERSFPNEVEKVSPKFKKIYNQAYTAEQMGLNEINGMGYRRSLEFLIKDYLLFMDQGKEDASLSQQDVYHMSLRSAIDKLSDDKLTALATASSWLGNDHAHTEVKWTDNTVKDLKAFIEAFVATVQRDIQINNAQKLIESKRHPSK